MRGTEFVPYDVATHVHVATLPSCKFSICLFDVAVHMILTVLQGDHARVISP
jgi:hypothetical protein